MIRELLSSDLMTRLGWTLLHSLWQLTLLGILLGITLALCSRRSARLRYGAACAALVLMFVPLVATFTYLPLPSGEVSVSDVPNAVRSASSVPSAGSHKISIPSIQPFDGNQIAESSSRSSLEASSADSPVPLKNFSSEETESASSVSTWMPWIVGFWLIGVCLLGIWNLGGWLIVQRLRSTATMPVSNHVRHRALELAQRLRLTRPVQLVESILIEVPMTIGWLKPMILLPASLLTGLTQSQLDAVLAHELAHIRRHDYLVNLLQSLAESLLFYHPAVWLVSRRIRIEREFCCDDEAIALSGDKAEYVNMLAQIEQNRIVPAHALALLGPHKGLTLERIRRILGISPSRSSEGISAFGSLLLILGVGIAVAFAQQQNSNEESTAPETVAVESNGNQLPQKRFQAEKPSPEADDPHTKLKATIDPEDFQVELDYRGDSDKPFYRALFTTAEVKPPKPEFSIVESMDRATAAKVYTWLDESGFYKHAVEEASERAIPVPGKPQYLLRISSAKRVLVENLGWDLGMLLRLESLRDELAEELPNRDEGSPQPSPLDPLLERLSGFRKSWTEGQPENDLKAKFSSAGTEFVSGQPISVKLQLQNIGQQVREYEQHSLSRSGFEIKVFDRFGRPVPYLGGPAQLPSGVYKMAPGETALLEEFDLAQFYYLRKPGTYFARYLGNNNSRSNRIEFTVSQGNDKELDIVGQLLPLVHGHWVLIGNPNFQGKVRPGSNFEEVEGTSIIFQDNPTGSKRDVSLIWLWFTEEQAKPRELPDERNHPPASTYLGIFGGKHLYAHRDEKSLKRWPTLLDDLHEALGDNANVSHTQRTQSTSDEAAHESTNSNRSRIATMQRDNPISRLVASLDESHGLWVNGPLPPIDLPPDAEMKEVLEQAIKMHWFHDGRIKTYKIISSREVTFEALGDQKYHAIQIESDRGAAILLCRYIGNFDDYNSWWTRFYDIPTRAEPEIKPEPEAEDPQSLRDLFFESDYVLKGKIWSTPKQEKLAEGETAYLFDLNMVTPLKSDGRRHNNSVAVIRRDDVEYVVPLELGTEAVFFLKRNGSELKAALITTNARDSVQPVNFADSQEMKELLKELNRVRLEESKARDKVFQDLHDRYKALILGAIKAEETDRLEQLSDQFNKSIGGKLVSVEVFDRIAPRRDPLGLFKKMYGDRKFNFEEASHILPEDWEKFPNVRKSSVFYLTLSHFEQEPNSKPYENYALVQSVGFEQHDSELPRWPDNLQIKMAFVAQNEWGIPNDDVLIRLRSNKHNWRPDETPRFELDVRNSSDKDITFIPHISTCDLECDGVWYVWGAPVAWGGPANVIPSQKLKRSGIDFQLVHDTPQGWVTKDQQQPLKLTEGKHTIRVALRTHEGPSPISNAITIGFGPHKLVPEPGENDPNRAVRAASAPQFEIKRIEDPKPVEEASVGLFHNGGFETPDHYNSLYNVYFPGPLGAWKVERGTVEIVTKYWTPAEGKQSLDLSGFQNKPGTISQEIITVPGRKYRVRFSAAANPEPDDVATLKQLKVFWGESESKTLEFDAKRYDFKNVGWKTYEFEVVATGKKTRLAFESLTTSPCGPILDDISVVQISE